MNKKIIIFFGPPGSGKGTQAAVLAQKLKLPVISPGVLFRQEQIKKTSLGVKINGVLNKGKLVADEIAEKIIGQRLKKKDARRGFILDGYPRNRKQLNKFLERLESEAGGKIFAILVNVSDSEVKKRLGGRRVCVCGANYHIKFNPPRKNGICDICGAKLKIRNDDKPAVINKRLKVYHKEINSIIEYWRKNGRLAEINGAQEIKKVQEDILRRIKI